MHEFPPETRVAAYPRVSTEEQKRHGLSIEAQTQALDAWARAHGLRIAAYYNDAGNSARKPYHKRPAMVRLLQDVQAGKIDLILFTRLDRWFRNVGEYYKVQEILDAHHVVWKAIQEDYDTTTAAGRLKINIMLSVAQDEADRDSERIRAVLESKRARREPVSGHVPTGYRIQGKKIVKDPALEGAVDCFFRTFLRLRSVEKARAAVQEQFGVSFSYQLASKMLSKEAYRGCFSGVEGMCPPYVTQEEFDEIQASRRRTQRRTQEDRVYLFTGLVFCPVCGRRWGARCHRYALRDGTWRERIAYNCPGRYQYGDCSNRVNMGEEQIERLLLERVDRALEDWAAQAGRLAESAPPRRDFQAERERLRKKLARLKDLYLDELIDLDLYRRDYQALNDQLDHLAAEENQCPPQAPDLGRLRALFPPGWQSLYRDLSRNQKQDFWRMALQSILIASDRSVQFLFRS